MKLFNFTKLNALCLSILLLTVYLIFFYYAEKKIYTKEKFTHKKIMFLVSTETFGGKGVYTMYNEMKRVGYDVKIVIVPHPHPNIQGGIDTKFIDKFNSQDVVYPCGKYEGGSTFLNYHYFVYNYALQHPEIHFIIRPHNTLITYAVGKGYLSQNDMDNILSRFNSLKNVTISAHAFRSLLDDVIAADIVISDGTSSLAEVVVADKPIIYLSNGWNNEFNSNTLSKELKKYIYFAYEPQDIINYIEFIKLNNYLPYHENIDGRNQFKKMLDPIENPAAFIAEYLLKNY